MEISVAPLALVWFALLLLLLPIDWLIAWSVAAVAHELFHCLAIILCRRRITGFCVSFNSAKIQTEPLTYGQTLFCAIAGPTGGFLLSICSSHFPQLAFCGFVQSVFNLLPVYPLDGGRALDAFTKLIFRENFSQIICKVVSLTVIHILLLFCIIAAIMVRSCLPLVIPVILLLQFRRK